MSLSQATEATRIDARYLEALENDAPLEEFPAPAYARFFLREYAQYLELNDHELLSAFESQHPVTEDNLPDLGARLTPIDRRPGRFTMAFLMVLSVLALGAIAVVSLVSAADRGVREPAVGTSPAAGPTASAPSPAPAVTVPDEPVFEDLRAVLIGTDRSWVRAIVDGSELPPRFLETDQRWRLQADRELTIRLGNAGGVRLRINGETHETGAPGEVVELSFRFRQGEVVQRPSA